jgi:hypothetical protein
MAFSRTPRSLKSKLNLSLETLEPRQMMAATPLTSNVATTVKYAELLPMSMIPALSSLPGAAKTIYLDFDGDFQSVWNRTDSGQTYRNVSSGASNLSMADIRKVWETVAEDFAPFNVNVTTVQPPSFANNTALRIVIAGDMTAQLVNGNNLINLAGDRFITNDNGASLLDTSGYAAINSFTNGEPNVVYVFGKYMSTWGTTSPEGHARSLAALVANTASHEAGHAFGLWHHGGVDASGNASDYHVGGSVTTPIMGDNTAADRTLWSSYTAGSQSFDSIARLTTTLGARPDDHASGTWFAEPLSFTSANWYSSSASVKGIIGTTSDQDWYKFSSSGAGVSVNLSTVEFANLDAKLELYKVTQTWFGPMTTLVASVDGPTLFGAPFSFLGASYSANLAAGDYMIAVKSHGGYSDLGNYTLTVSQNTLRAVVGGVYYGSYAGQSYAAPAMMSGAGGTAGKAGGLGQGAGGVGQIAALDAIYSQSAEPVAAKSAGLKLAVKKSDPIDAIVREKLGSGLGAVAATRLVDLAFAA